VLLAIAAIFAGGFALRRAARPVSASLLLAILAFPSVSYGLFLVVAITSGVRWN
jgi:hypothetical protein